MLDDDRQPLLGADLGCSAIRRSTRPLAVRAGGPYSKERPATPLFLTPEEAKRLIVELPIHLSRMARFALATGLREANVRMLEWAQIDLQRSCAWIRGENAKAGKSIAVLLSADTLAVVNECKGDRPQRVFTYQGRPIARKVSNPRVPGSARACRRSMVPVA